MYDDIRKQGELAARQGLSLWDCPYLKAQAMPGHTGESPATWQAKLDTWEAGWAQGKEVTRPPPSHIQFASPHAVWVSSMRPMTGRLR